MTTILADMRRRVMVADTMATVAGSRANICKVLNIRGSLVATAGSVEICEEFCSRLREGAPLDIQGADDEDSGMQALVMTPAGELHYYTGRHPMLIKDHVFGIGTGGPAAIAAYLALEMSGLPPDPVIAVEAAMAVDAMSGGRAEVFSLEPAVPAKQKVVRRGRA